MDNFKEEVKFKGVVTAQRYLSDNGWGIKIVTDEDTGEELCVVGNWPASAVEGEIVTVTGRYKNHERFGKQLEAFRDGITVEQIDVMTEEGVIRLLMKLPNIGKKKAVIAVKKFGPEEAYRLAESDPCAVGVQAKNKEAAILIIEDLVVKKGVYILLAGIGVSDNKVEKIIEYWGLGNVHDKLSGDPYSLTGCDGFGFLSVDTIALMAGVLPNSVMRLKACTLYTLRQNAKNEGNIFVPGWELLKLVVSDLGESLSKATEFANKKELTAPRIDSIPTEEDVRSVIKTELVMEGSVKVANGNVYDAKLYKAEGEILEACGIKF